MGSERRRAARWGCEVSRKFRYHYLNDLETTMDFADFELSEHDRAAPVDDQDLA